MSVRAAAGPSAYAGLAFLTLVWGSAFALIKVAVADIPPEATVLLRLIIASAVLSGWTVYRGERLPPLRDVRWRWFAALGVCGNVLPFFLTAWGQQTVPSGLAGILIGAMPLATIAGAHFLLKGERLTARRALGFILGFLGVVALMGPAALADLGGPTFIAQLAIFAAALSYACNALLAQAAPETSPSVAAAGMVIAAAVFSAPAGLYGLATLDAAPGWPAITAVFALGLFPTALTAIVYLALARSQGAAFIAQTNYLTPLVAALIGLGLGEPLGVSAAVALALILAGLAIARRR